MEKKELVDKIIKTILQRKVDKKAMVVAFDGVDTSGKTSLADEIDKCLKEINKESIRVSIDKFHNQKQIRVQKGENSPEGFYYDSFNYDKIIELVLNPIKYNNKLITNGIFDYRSESKIDQHCVNISEKSIILFDGIFLHRDEIKDYWDLSFFLDITFETVIKRAIQRDKEYFGTEEKVLEKYNNRYIPGEELYLRLCNPKERADFVIDNNDWNNPVLIKGKFI
jgi:uridine kinase